MSNQQKPQDKPTEKSKEELDAELNEQLEDSFPASDPPKVTRIPAGSQIVRSDDEESRVKKKAFISARGKVSAHRVCA